MFINTNDTESYENIISEFKIIGFTEEQITNILHHAIKYYEHMNMTTLNAILLDRNFIMEELNKGSSKEEAIESLYRKYLIESRRTNRWQQ